MRRSRGAVLFHTERRHPSWGDARQVVCVTGWLDEITQETQIMARRGATRRTSSPDSDG